MKTFKKIAAMAAGIICAAAMAVSASASVTVVPQDGYTRSSSGSFLVMLYSDGTYDASEKAVTNYGIDCTTITTVEVTVKAADPDFFTGDFGGGIVMSSKSADDASSHNWNSQEYWGVTDDEAEIDTLADKPAKFERVGDYTYKATVKLEGNKAVIADYDFVQFAIQDWGVDEITVQSIVMKDASGNEVISFDANGKASLPLVTDAAPAAETTEAAEEAAPVEETTAAATTAATTTVTEAAEEVETVVNADDSAAQQVVTPAPTTTTTTTTTTTGNVQAATDSSKGSPDTGIADVAAVAGIAVAAAGAVVLAKKRK